jgi:flagellar biosynthesis/type III secretory pathway chaperone
MSTPTKSLNTGKLEQSGARELVLSRNPDHAMQEMMETINSLRAVYAEENAALLAADTRLFLALQERKIQTVRNYQAATQQIISRRDEFKSVKPEVRHQLRGMQEDFSKLSAVNLHALDRMRKSVQRLGARIMNAARESVQKTSVNYGASGSMNKIERAVSIGLNESA